MSLKDLAKTEKKVSWEVNKVKRRFIICAVCSVILLLGLSVVALFAKGSYGPCMLYNNRICSLTALREQYEHANMQILDIEYQLIRYHHGLITFEEVMAHILAIQTLLRIQYLILQAEQEVEK